MLLVRGREEVGEPLAEGVADLGDDAGELAALVAVEEADRVEHVAEHAEVRQEQDPVGLDPVLGQVGAHVEVVAVVEADQAAPVPAEQAHAPVELGQLVEVEQVEADAVAEDVLLRRLARVHHGAGVERGPHQLAPKAAAAARPERSPSSWKQYPCQAPAKAVRRGPFRRGSSGWARIDSRVTSGWR